LRISKFVEPGIKGKKVNKYTFVEKLLQSSSTTVKTIFFQTKMMELPDNYIAGSKISFENLIKDHDGRKVQ